MMKRVFVKGGLAAIGVLSLILAGTVAQAATRTMVGSVAVVNPSVSPPNFYEVGPQLFGQGIRAYGADTGPVTISVEGTATGTSPSRAVTVPANALDFSGFQSRLFPTFPAVGNGMKSYMSTHNAATFMAGGGALAACPGPGCTSSGSGTAISWCPPIAENTANPAPGITTGVTTPMSLQVGNWDCGGWVAGVGGGDQFLQISITNNPAAMHFGGTFTMLRNTIQDNWNNDVLPTVFPGTGQATRNFRRLAAEPWPGGQPNFAYNADIGFPGPVLDVTFATPGGFITGTDGCAAGTPGTADPGGVFMLGQAIGGVGTNCGTTTVQPDPLREWGFKMTTGTISGSDPFPGAPFFPGKIVTTMATYGPGTPFAPNIRTRASTLGFFFSRMGLNTVTTGPGTRRNLVLLGGGVATDPISGNTFYRLTELRFKLLPVPEPMGIAGVGIGIAGLAALARRRRKA